MSSTTFVADAEIRSFQRAIFRRGGRIVHSHPVGRDGYRVTFWTPVG